MKTYKEITSRLVLTNESEPMDESVLRTGTSIFLVSKIKDLYKKIRSTKFSSTDEPDIQLEKLFHKIDLLSDQSQKLSYLIAQLDYMKKGK